MFDNKEDEIKHQSQLIGLCAIRPGSIVKLESREDLLLDSTQTSAMSKFN